MEDKAEDISEGTSTVVTTPVAEVNAEEKDESTWTMAKSKKRKLDRMEVGSETEGRPRFPPMKKMCLTGGEEMRQITIPTHRRRPLEENWGKIFTPVVEHLFLQMRCIPKAKMVQIRTCQNTKEIGALQKACDFVQAFMYGFSVDDALALIRLDGLYVETFDIKDVKPLHGDHVSRAIGRMVGKGGKTRYAIENATKTRIVIAESKIHILGSFKSIRVARTTLCNLILGNKPSKVYGTLKILANRASESI